MDKLSETFAPLTEDEISQGVRDDPQAAREAQTICPPTDAEHGRDAAARLLGRAPDQLWRYTMPDGKSAFYVARTNKPDGKKDFWPVSWVDGAGWALKAWPDHRPLYRLDKIAATPQAPIVICEGEKAVDAAEKIFLQSLVTTSSGGAGAAAKSDWTPLAGRRVLIWPDNDAPGAKYAGEVAGVLAALNCEVSIIDAKALASMAPGGGAREPVEKWDAADAAAEWSDLGALGRAAVNLAKPFDHGPAYLSFKPFEMSADGLTVEIEKGRGENKTTEEIWISAPFEILGASRDPHGRAWGKWLCWRDRDGREHCQHIADAATHGDPAKLAAALADGGLTIARGSHRHLATYLASARPKGRITLVEKTGWHEIDGGRVFVLPGGTIRTHGAGAVVLDAMARGPYDTRGSLLDWQKGVAARAADHALAVLAISAALAGPLLNLVVMEGGGLNFFGASSKGKTTILQSAASVWGRGGSPGYVRAWRATANGLEGAAAGANDTALVLDELGTVEARDAAAGLYSLSNGTGKARAGRDGSLREPKSWRVLLISSGEIPTETKLAEDRGRRARAGQLVRLLDVPADRGCGFGAFDHAGPDGDAANLSNAIKSAATSAYGTAGPALVRAILTHDPNGEAARAIIAAFVEGHTPTAADGQVIRAAQRFGLIAAAGELATEWGLTPWRPGAVIEAAAWALERWIERRGGADPAEARQAIATVRAVIEAHGDSRFERLGDPDARSVQNRLGWRKGDGAEREWWVTPENFKQDICAGLDPTAVAKALAERGFLRMQGGRGYQCKVNIGGEHRIRAYVLTAGILDGGDDAA